MNAETHDWSDISTDHISAQRQSAALREKNAKEVWAIRDRLIEAYPLVEGEELASIHTKVTELGNVAAHIERHGGWYCQTCCTIRDDSEPWCANCAVKENNDLRTIGNGG